MDQCEYPNRYRQVLSRYSIQLGPSSEDYDDRHLWGSSGVQGLGLTPGSNVGVAMAEKVAWDDSTVHEGPDGTSFTQVKANSELKCIKF